MHLAVSGKQDTLAELCRRFHVRRLNVFGSAARGVDFDPRHGDFDFLIEFEPGCDPGTAGFLDIKQALGQTIGRPAIERSRNDIRRRQIPREAEAVHVAG